MASSPTAVALMNQRTFCARVRSRREEAEHDKDGKTHQNRNQLLGQLVRHGRAGDGSDSVHRKNAIVSISKPMRRNRRMTMKYAQQITVKTKGERNGGGRLGALRDNELQTGEDLEQRQQYERTHMPAGLPSMRRSTICARFSSAVK